MADFPNEKRVGYRKPWSEVEVIRSLESGQLRFEPLQVLSVNNVHSRNTDYDGTIEMAWKQHRVRYVFEYKANNSLRTLATVQWQIRSVAERENLLPLIIVPYLNEEALKNLEENDISGLDLCGNGVILSPDFRLWRTGHENQFKDSRLLRNPYRGDSSIFARCFLLRSDFESLSQLQEFALARTFAQSNASFSNHLALGTASKVVQSLADELIVQKEGKRISLLDAQRLLLHLRRNAREASRLSLLGKTSLSQSQIWEKLSEAMDNNGLRGVATGVASAGRYRVLSGVEMLSLYVSDLERASELLEVRSTRAFANIQIFEERKNVVYFDARTEGSIRWASPIQTWLELANGASREQEAAEELERLLKNGHGDELF